jgi:hypothetical protein
MFTTKNISTLILTEVGIKPLNKLDNSKLISSQALYHLEQHILLNHQVIKSSESCQIKQLSIKAKMFLSFSELGTACLT